jgi:ferredoxin--NADP+ reductase
VTAPGDEPAAAYQVWDPAAQRPLTGIFVVGWARRASDGVVGRARLDAETGIKHVLEFLAGRPQRPAAESERLIAALTETLAKRGVDFVTYADVQQLEAVEKARAQAEKIEEFKFASDREMLAALGR